MAIENIRQHHTRIIRLVKSFHPDPSGCHLARIVT